MNEQELIKEILSGNTQHFSFFVEKYQLMAYNIAFRILENNEEAEEAVQDSFVKAYQALSDFRSGSKFSTWLYRIVYNTSITALRKQSLFVDYGETEVPAITTDEMDQATSILERKDRKEIISKVFRKIPSDESLILTLYYLEECSVDEIHQITGLTPSNIKIKLFRGRKRFYEVLDRMMKHEISNIL